MCDGAGCEAREKCYRFTATPNEFRQAYMKFTELPKDDDGKCESFTPNFEQKRKTP